MEEGYSERVPLIPGYPQAAGLSAIARSLAIQSGLESFWTEIAFIGGLHTSCAYEALQSETASVPADL